MPLGCVMSDAVPPVENLKPADKVKQFPAAPGCYLMKDCHGRVLYVGKAKNLRNRASHYFTEAAAQDMRTCSPKSFTLTRKKRWPACAIDCPFIARQAPMKGSTSPTAAVTNMTPRR